MKRGIARRGKDSNVVVMICGMVRREVPVPTKKTREDIPRQKAIGSRKTINPKKLRIKIVPSTDFLLFPHSFSGSRLNRSE
jgi:hypothetical protein